MRVWEEAEKEGSDKERAKERWEGVREKDSELEKERERSEGVGGLHGGKELNVAVIFSASGRCLSFSWLCRSFVRRPWEQAPGRGAALSRGAEDESAPTKRF